MIPRSKQFRYIAVAFVAGLSLAGCGKGCGKQGGGGSQQESLSLIPVDSNIVVGMNWKKIQASPMGAKMMEGVPAEAQPFLKDVDGMTLGMKIEGVERDAKDFVGIVNGKLDSAALIKQMTDQAQKTGTTMNEEDYEGVKIYSTAKEPTFGVAMVGQQAIFGKKDTVKRSLDLAKKKGDSVEKNKAVMDLIGGVDKGKMLWAVAKIPEGMIPAGAGGGMGNPMSALSSVKAIDLGIDYNENLNIDLGVITGTKEDAQQMMTMANSYKTLFGASLASKSPELGKILGALSIDAKENKVLLALKLDKATVEDLAAKAKAQQAAMPMGGMPDEGPGGAPAVPPPPPGAPGTAESAPSAP
ncbi:MAG: hypothetical protein K8R69_07770 [Deltaproteobacteria bacterium]|nr:hypothetical protein [Deltaproteobacteria bacterium]